MANYRVEVNGDDSLLARIPNIFDQTNEPEQNTIAENIQNISDHKHYY